MDYKVYKGQKFLCNTKIVNGIGAQIGLMFKMSLKKGETLTLELPKPRVDIHTWFVFFPIDLFFLDENFKVIEKASMNPWKIYLPKKKAKYLLEANKGELKIELKDPLMIKKILPIES
jgi:uncharacterized membrane protein (UPF0127 family)